MIDDRPPHVKPRPELARAYVNLHRQLTALPEDDFEGVRGDAIRDQMEPIWRLLGGNEGVVDAVHEIGERLE